MSEYFKPTPYLHYRQYAIYRSYYFWCPGCERLHLFDVGDRFAENPADPRWLFSGDYERPTFTPSLKYTNGACHLFLIDGRIRYLDDCRHKLAGTTIKLAVIPEDKIYRSPHKLDGSKVGS